MELRRSDKVQEARATLRRLIASLLFWLPFEETGKAHRSPGFGKLPRAITGHEKTALRQFQVKQFQVGPILKILAQIFVRIEDSF